MTIAAIIIALLIFAVIALLLYALVRHFTYEEDREDDEELRHRIQNNYDQDDNQRFI